MCCILPTAVLQPVWVQRQQEGGEKGKEGEAEARTGRRGAAAEKVIVLSRALGQAATQRQLQTETVRC